MRTPSRTLLLLGVFAFAACDNNPAGPGAPAEIQVVSGQDQQGTVGQALVQPLVAKVVDDDGDPVSGQLVNFVVTRGGGTVLAAFALTNAQGVAQNAWTLGTVADSQRVEARAVDASGAPLPAATFRALAQAGAAASVTAGQAQVSGAPGAALDSVGALVKDAFGNPVAGAAVAWTVASGGGSVSPATSATDAQGVARTRWTLGANLGTQTLQAAIGGSTATFTATPALGAGVTLAIVSGDGQTGTVAAELAAPLVVEVRQNGVPVQGVQVQWSTPFSNGDVTPATSVTDVQGRASARWTLPQQAGNRVAVAQVPGPGLAVGFDATAAAGAPVRVFANSLPPGYSQPVGATISVAFGVADAYGNGVPGATLNVAATPSGSANPASATTGADGFAYTSWSLPTTPMDAARLTASAPGLAGSPSYTVIVKQGPSVSLRITPDVRTVAPNADAPFDAIVSDAYGNQVRTYNSADCGVVIWSTSQPAHIQHIVGQLARLGPIVIIHSEVSTTVTARCQSLDLTDTAQVVIQ